MIPRWLRDLRFRLFYYFLTRPRKDLVTLGSECPWTIVDNKLTPKSHVVCAGVGNDISFEKALVHKYGCEMVILDPSPTGLATMSMKENTSDKFKFLPVGLADVDGDVPFAEPAHVEEGSFRSNSSAAGAVLKLPCKKLSTLLQELKWPKLDLLKLDIEGSEYSVLAGALNSRLDIEQICVEFHHGREFNHRRAEMISAIISLRKAGYDLVHRTMWDHTFLRTR